MQPPVNKKISEGIGKRRKYILRVPIAVARVLRRTETLTYYEGGPLFPQRLPGKHIERLATNSSRSSGLESCSQTLTWIS